jgi:glutamate--cysteine ligase
MLQFTGCNAVEQFSQHGASQVLRQITRGFEKECLRVNPDGSLAQTFHPQGLGSKLTHPWITTDYSEALLEFITPPSQDPEFALPFLRELHRYTAQQMGNELMWAGSMPCRLGDENSIPLADYGNSNTANIKKVYRQGLALRYGRHMQTIAGVHFNWSLPPAFWEQFHAFCGGGCGSLDDFVNERYFGLIRNFLRYSWLIPYLFGASPAVDTSFLQGRKPQLELLGHETMFGQHATCLRMSDLGYQNRAQSKLHITYNSLQGYADALDAAIHTPDPFYEAIGARTGTGPQAAWKQLNTNVLQIENEFYAGIRPKRVGLQGERPALALKRYGVEYLEVRLFDLNPLIDIGIAPEQSLFCDVFLLMCLLRDSPPISPREQAENDENKRRVVNRGRDPDLHLLVHNQDMPFRPLAHELFDDMRAFATLLDGAFGGTQHSSAMAQLRGRIDAPETTPSAMVLEQVKAAGSLSDWLLQRSQAHRASLLSKPMDAVVRQQLVDATARSLVAHADIEASPQIPFEDYVAQYFA